MVETTVGQTKVLCGLPKRPNQNSLGEVPGHIIISKIGNMLIQLYDEAAAATAAATAAAAACGLNNRT